MTQVGLLSNAETVCPSDAFRGSTAVYVGMSILHYVDVLCEIILKLSAFRHPAGQIYV